MLLIARVCKIFANQIQFQVFPCVLNPRQDEPIPTNRRGGKVEYLAPRTHLLTANETHSPREATQFFFKTVRCFAALLRS